MNTLSYSQEILREPCQISIKNLPLKLQRITTRTYLENLKEMNDKFPWFCLLFVMELLEVFSKLSLQIDKWKSKIIYTFLEKLSCFKFATHVIEYYRITFYLLIFVSLFSGTFIMWLEINVFNKDDKDIPRPKATKSEKSCYRLFRSNRYLGISCPYPIIMCLTYNNAFTGNTSFPNATVFPTWYKHIEITQQSSTVCTFVFFFIINVLP